MKRKSGMIGVWSQLKACGRGLSVFQAFVGQNFPRRGMSNPKERPAT